MSTMNLSDTMLTALAEIARYGSTDASMTTCEALFRRGLIGKYGLGRVAQEYASRSWRVQARQRRAAGVTATVTAAGQAVLKAQR